MRRGNNANTSADGARFEIRPPLPKGEGWGEGERDNLKPESQAIFTPAKPRKFFLQICGREILLTTPFSPLRLCDSALNFFRIVAVGLREWIFHKFAMFT